MHVLTWRRAHPWEGVPVCAAPHCCVSTRLAKVRTHGSCDLGTRAGGSRAVASVPRTSSPHHPHGRWLFGEQHLQEHSVFLVGHLAIRDRGFELSQRACPAEQVDEGPRGE